MENDPRMAFAVGLFAIVGLSAVAALQPTAEIRAGMIAAAGIQIPDGEATVKRENQRFKQVQASSTASASASGSARASASASASVSAGSGETDCAADAGATADSDGKRVIVRESQSSRSEHGACSAAARAVAGEDQPGND